jgi:hypothetical protein
LGVSTTRIEFLELTLSILTMMIYNSPVVDLAGSKRAG